MAHPADYPLGKGKPLKRSHTPSTGPYDAFSVIRYDETGQVTDLVQTTRSEIGAYRIDELLYGADSGFKQRDVPGYDLGTPIRAVSHAEMCWVPLYPREVALELPAPTLSDYDTYATMMEIFRQCSAMGLYVDLTTGDRKLRFIDFCEEVILFQWKLNA